MFAPWLQRQWQSLTPWHVLLLPISWLFGLLSAARRLLYRTGVLRAQRLPAPVVVVGNITVGGSGKTPLTLWLAQRLQERGLHPCIISRGYGGSAHLPREVDRNSKAEQVGDEAVLLAMRGACPVWVGADRVATGHALMQAHPECDLVLSDDGLQHYRMARDFEIAVIDGARGLGNGYLLPAGALREPAARLACVDAIVLNETTSDPARAPALPRAALRMRLVGDAMYPLLDAGTALPLTRLSGQRVHAVAGIGNPRRFFDDLRAAGAQPIEHVFADHHPFVAGDLAFDDALPVVMTEKDAVKCYRFAAPNWYVRPVRAEVDEQLVNLILERVKRRDGSKIA